MPNYNYLGLYPANESVLTNRALSPNLYTNTAIGMPTSLKNSLKPYKLQSMNQTTSLSGNTQSLLQPITPKLSTSEPQLATNSNVSGYADFKQPTDNAGSWDKTSNALSAIGNIASVMPSQNRGDSQDQNIKMLGDSTTETFANSKMPWFKIPGTISKVAGAARDPFDKATNYKFSLSDADGKTGFTKYDKLTDNTSFKVLVDPIGSAINVLGKKDASGTNKDIASNITMGYSSSQELGAKSLGGVSRLISKKARDNFKAYKSAVARVDTENAIKSRIINKAKEDNILASNSQSTIADKNQEQLNNSKYLNILSSKKGSKFLSRNVIPSGALHARKHNITTISNITTKGIPIVSGEVSKDEVVLAKEGSKIEQLAEIERDELTLSLEVTNEIEGMYKKYKESKDDSILVEVGKFLTGQILYNTDDNTNLIPTINV